MRRSADVIVHPAVILRFTASEMLNWFDCQHLTLSNQRTRSGRNLLVLEQSH